jgi:hypothetical protein
MKLHREILVQEMTGPVPFELTMREIIDNGDVTNHYHVYALALLSQFFKDGQRSTVGMLDGLPTLSSEATSVAVIESIKALSPAEKVGLATYLLSCLEVGESSLFNSQMSTLDWIMYVLQRQK